MAGKPVARERREREAADRGKPVPEGAPDRSKGVARRSPRVPEGARRLCVERAGAIGVSAAAAEVGVSPATVRAWRSKLKAQGVEIPEASGESVAPVAEASVSAVPAAADGADRIASIDELISFAKDMLATARVAQEAVLTALREGKYTGAYHAALASAVSVDKTGVLSAAVERLEGVQHEITEQQANQLREWLARFFDAVGLGAILANPASLELLRLAQLGEHDRELAAEVRELAWGELDRSRRRALPAMADVAEILEEDEEPVDDAYADGRLKLKAGERYFGPKDEGLPDDPEPVEDAEVVGDSEPVQPSERPSPAEESLERLARRDGSSMHPVRGVSRGPRQSGYKRFGRAG